MQYVLTFHCASQCTQCISLCTRRFAAYSAAPWSQCTSLLVLEHIPAGVGFFDGTVANQKHRPVSLCLLEALHLAPLSLSRPKPQPAASVVAKYYRNGRVNVQVGLVACTCRTASLSTTASKLKRSLRRSSLACPTWTPKRLSTGNCRGLRCAQSYLNRTSTVP